MLDDARICPKQPSGVRTPRKGDDIPFIDVIQDVSCGTTNQLQGTLRQNARFINGPHHSLGQERCGGCRLDDCRHSGQPIHGHFLQHSPNWEIEGIYMYRDSLLGDQDVVSTECAPFAHRQPLTIQGKRLIWKLSPQTRIGEQISNPALNVNPSVDAGGASGETDLVKLLFP